MKQWQVKAWELFLKTNHSIGQIASLVNRSRKTVSGFLNGHEGYDEVCKRRNARNAEKQRERNRRRMKRGREEEKYLEIAKEL